MKAEQEIFVEMKRLASSGERVPTELSLQTRAIAAVMDRIIAKLPTVSERRQLEKLREADE